MIVALTGHTESEYYMAAFNKGIDQIYSKPISSLQIGLILLECGFKITMTPKLEQHLAGK